MATKNKNLNDDMTMMLTIRINSIDDDAHYRREINKKMCAGVLL